MKPKSGAAVLIMSPDRILLFHRDNIPTIISPNCWQLVGGGIEKGETPKEGLIREVKEEVCFDLKKFDFVKKIVGQLGEEKWFYVAFVDKNDEVKFKLGPDEGQGIDWFTIDEALAINLTPGTRILLSEYRDLIEEMMKTKSVPSIEKLDLIPKKFDVVN